jgi:uncharacterized protein (TIGR01777 family)
MTSDHVKSRPSSIVVAGGSGLIGSALAASLIEAGVPVTVLSRDAGRRAKRVPDGATIAQWDPRDPRSAVDALRGAAAVVNTSGEAVGPLPWTPWRRRAIVESRVGTARTLATAIGLLPPEDRPPVLVNASGTDGYTGIDAEPATEEAETSHGFLADLVTDWEAAAHEADRHGTRVVTVRTSFVIAAASPLLTLFALPSRLFLGGRYGSGRQWFSWVHLDDLVRVYRLAIDDASLRGPINVSGEPLPQIEVARAFGRILRRPAAFPTPAWLLRLVMGEQSTLLLGSRRVSAARLRATGFELSYPTFEPALRNALGRD